MLSAQSFCPTDKITYFINHQKRVFITRRVLMYVDYIKNYIIYALLDIKHDTNHETV